MKPRCKPRPIDTEDELSVFNAWSERKVQRIDSPGDRFFQRVGNRFPQFFSREGRKPDGVQAHVAGWSEEQNCVTARYDVDDRTRFRNTGLPRHRVQCPVGTRRTRPR